MFMLKNVRMSYPVIYKPEAFKKNAPKYSAVFLLEPDSDQHKAVMEEIKRVAKEAFEGKAVAVLKKQNASDRKLVREGNDKVNDDDVITDGYEDMVYIKGANKSKVKLVNRDRSALTEEDGVLYGGCYVNAQLDIWAHDNDYGKFINCKLLAIQFWGEGEPFSTDTAADLDAFETTENLEPISSEDDDIPW